MIGSINDHFMSSISFAVADGTYAFKSPRNTSPCGAARRPMDVLGGFTTAGSIQPLVDQADDERPKADQEALVELLLNVSRMAMDLRDRVKEFDLNPVRVLQEGHGVVALDALVVRP